MPKRVRSLRGPSPRHWGLGGTAPLEEMLQQCRAVGNTVSDFTGLTFEHQTSRSRDERVTARPTVRSHNFLHYRYLTGF